MAQVLKVSGLHANVKDDNNEKEIEILKGLDIEINKGEMHVLMGTNGSGKSTLANVLMGHPNYNITAGSISFCGKDLLKMTTDERARAGLFLAQQYPTVVPGLAIGGFLRASVEAVNGEQMPIRTFRKEVKALIEELGIPKDYLKRSLNEGFSGGEKKRSEILQMNMLKPKLAMLDETDSGLDVDALKTVFANVKKTRNSENAFLVITHYNKVLQYLEPTHVHVMKGGMIVKSGGTELSDMIEERGFEAALQS